MGRPDPSLNPGPPRRLIRSDVVAGLYCHHIETGDYLGVSLGPPDTHGNVTTVDDNTDARHETHYRELRIEDRPPR